MRADQILLCSEHRHDGGRFILCVHRVILQPVAVQGRVRLQRQVPDRVCRSGGGRDGDLEREAVEGDRERQGARDARLDEGAGRRGSGGRRGRGLLEDEGEDGVGAELGVGLRDVVADGAVRVAADGDRGREEEGEGGGEGRGRERDWIGMHVRMRMRR